MKVVVDFDGCMGHGQCEEVAPDVFRINDDAIVDVLLESPPEEMRADVEEAARRCPAFVITIVD